MNSQQSGVSQAFRTSGNLGYGEYSGADLPSPPSELEERIGEAWDALERYRGSVIRIVTHYDADGIAAGAITHTALERAGFRVHTRCVKQLEKDVLKELGKENLDVVVFTDLGSGQIENIERYIDGNCIILDHHEPSKDSFSGIHINAHLFGIDGAREVSGSGMAYLFARHKGNRDLAALAVVGAVGDLQDSHGRFLGMNAYIARDGVEAGVLRVEIDLRLYGRQTRPIYKALEYTTDPFIPGLSGSESSCIAFLNQLNIPIKKGENFTMLADLNEEEKKRLANALILKMVEAGIPVKVAESIIGEVATLLKEERRTPLRDAREFATLLNACGKSEKAGIGLAVALGERGELYAEALRLLSKHREYINTCLSWVTQNLERVESRDNFYALRAGEDIDENVIGTVAGLLLNSRVLEELKPVIALAHSKDGMLKVSGRANRELVERGVDLGKALRKASERVGGEGGGHDVAAGAKISRQSEEEFLKIVEEELRRQLT